MMTLLAGQEGWCHCALRICAVVSSPTYELAAAHLQICLASITNTAAADISRRAQQSWVDQALRWGIDAVGPGTHNTCCFQTDFKGRQAVTGYLLAHVHLQVWLGADLPSTSCCQCRRCYHRCRNFLWGHAEAGDVKSA